MSDRTLRLSPDDLKVGFSPDGGPPPLLGSFQVPQMKIYEAERVIYTDGDGTKWILKDREGKTPRLLEEGPSWEEFEAALKGAMIRLHSANERAVEHVSTTLVATGLCQHLFVHPEIEEEQPDLVAWFRHQMKHLSEGGTWDHKTMPPAEEMSPRPEWPAWTGNCPKNCGKAILMRARNFTLDSMCECGHEFHRCTVHDVAVDGSPSRPGIKSCTCRIPLEAPEDHREYTCGCLDEEGQGICECPNQPRVVSKGES